MSRKVLTTVYLTRAQLAELQALSVRTRVPYAHYVREAIDLVLAVEGGATNAVDDGTTDRSE